LGFLDLGFHLLLPTKGGNPKFVADRIPIPNAVVPALGAASLPEHHESAAEDFRIQLPWGRVFCRQNAIPV
jgi:hypothetical protein